MIKDLTKIIAKYGTNKLIVDKELLTSNPLLNGVKKSLITTYGYNTIDKTIDKTTEAINNIPSTISKELQRQAYHEASNNFNIGNYDYWGEYYKSDSKRYSPTPEPNLAELLYLQEQANRKIRGY